MQSSHNWKADIISLSVGFEDGIFPELQDAIKQAIDHKTIVMAAAGNSDNAFSGIPYPASEHGVFKIFSVDGMGRMPSNSPLVAKDAGLGFAAPGVSVESIYPLNLVETLKSRKLSVTIKAVGTEPKGPWTVMTGTSFATPIAAAIAAVILQFCDLNRDQLKEINCRVVRNVLSQLSVPLDGGIHMLNPMREVLQDDQELIAHKLLWIIRKAIGSVDM
jgi:subtilisin family serine protease